MSDLAGLFKQKYPALKGEDWIHQLSDEDKRVLVWNWRRHSLFGHLGGLARASTAERDARGRFVPNVS